MRLARALLLTSNTTQSLATATDDQCSTNTRYSTKQSNIVTLDCSVEVISPALLKSDSQDCENAAQVCLFFFAIYFVNFASPSTSLYGSRMCVCVCVLWRLNCFFTFKFGKIHIRLVKRAM